MIAWSLVTLYVSENLAIPKRITLNEYNFYMAAFGTVVGCVFVPFSMGRLRDLNFSGWLVKLLVFPLIGVIMLPLLCFLSGPRWTNDYGDPPPPSGMLKVCLALALCAVAVLFSYAALSDFYKARYLLVYGE
jgi:uncharacterized membrane protein YhaH (DUF805 family)